MIDELKRLRELTESLTGNGYLKDQAEEWEYALDAVPDYVYIVNNKHEIKFANKAIVNRLNTTKKDLYNKMCFFDVEEEENVFPVTWKNSTSKSALKEVYLKNLNGWFDITRSPIYNKENKLLGFICVLQDVTEKKNAKEQVANREATITALFNIAPVGIGVISVGAHKVIAVNKFLSNLLECEDEDLIDSSVVIGEPVNEELGSFNGISYPNSRICTIELSCKNGKCVSLLAPVVSAGDIIVFIVK